MSIALLLQKSSCCFFIVFLLVRDKMFTSVFGFSRLMVSASGPVFQVDCDYQNEWLGNKPHATKKLMSAFLYDFDQSVL